METRSIKGLTLFFDAKEQEAAELVGGACEQSLELTLQVVGAGDAGRLSRLCHDLVAILLVSLNPLVVADLAGGDSAPALCASRKSCGIWPAAGPNATARGEPSG